jgi:hypothetical protein
MKTNSSSEKTERHDCVRIHKYIFIKINYNYEERASGNHAEKQDVFRAATKYATSKKANRRIWMCEGCWNERVMGQRRVVLPLQRNFIPLTEKYRVSHVKAAPLTS